MTDRFVYQIVNPSIRSTISSPIDQVVSCTVDLVVYEKLSLVVRGAITLIISTVVHGAIRNETKNLKWQIDSSNRIFMMLLI